jgi:hypothetical protein
MQDLNQYNLFKRKNNYNEDDGDFGQLPEENMIVATWINDLGNSHKEYDDKIIFFNVSNFCLKYHFRSLRDPLSCSPHPLL